MPLPGFVFRSWPYELGRSSATVASAALAVADALEEDSGQLSAAATNERYVGVALEAKASSDSTTNPVQVLYCYAQRTKFNAPAEAGTFVAADVHTRVDLNSADGLNANDTTNGDFYVAGFSVANTGYGVFARGVATL